MIPKKTYIYGKHAVKEALRNTPHIVRRVESASGALDTELKGLIAKTNVETGRLDPRKLSSQVERNAPHQGVIALVSLQRLPIPFEEFDKTFAPTTSTLLVLLAGLQDPHNIGTIIRSAAAFGASAVLMPTHDGATLTPAAAKASSGMAFRIPIVELSNTQQALAALKKKGVTLYGLEARGTLSLNEVAFNSPTLLALGNEATGLPPYAKALCDTTLSIPIDPVCESLNVAAAAAVALYAWRIATRPG